MCMHMHLYCVCVEGLYGHVQDYCVCVDARIACSSARAWKVDCSADWLKPHRERRSKSRASTRRRRNWYTGLQAAAHTAAGFNT